MSALGQKQTCALQNVMSALHPIATTKAKFRKRPCPLYPRKRTCAVQLGMSAMGHKRTFAHYSIISSARAARLGGASIPVAQLRFGSRKIGVDQGLEVGNHLLK